MSDHWEIVPFGRDSFVFVLVLDRRIAPVIAEWLIAIEFAVMLTEYIGTIGRVEAGQIIVVVGKTVDAASRWDAKNLESECQVWNCVERRACVSFQTWFKFAGG